VQSIQQSKVDAPGGSSQTKALLSLLRQLDQLRYGPPPLDTDAQRARRDQLQKARALARQLEALCKVGKVDKVGKAHRTTPPKS
jgi:hypothetical protein